MILRPYQEEAIESIYNYFEKFTGNPLVVVPTAGGKSFIIADFCRRVIEPFPDQRIMIVTHVKELIEQNYLELCKIWQLAPAGIYSAGLNRRDLTQSIIFAGIQSVHSKAEEFGKFDLIIIDEGHLVPDNTNTMYQRFIKDMLSQNEQLKVIGFTATHYRLDSGLLTEGDNRIFTDVCYEVSIRRLIDEGYLCNLITKGGVTKYELGGVKTRGGEYVPADLQAAMNQQSLTETAVSEIIDYGINTLPERKNWLIFCAGVQHAQDVCDELITRGIDARTVSSLTPKGQRDKILKDFKLGKFRALTNCDMLTTGFNSPAMDLLVMLRPTKSTGLYVQMIGRGMRNAPGKENCLIMDFAGNIKRHGPIDRIKPLSKKKRGENDEHINLAKECPICHALISIGFRECPDCGFLFPESKPQHDETATDLNILSKPEWADVTYIEYDVHEKRDKPDSLKVTYYSGSLGYYSEWVCLEHKGYARTSARNWWREHCNRETTPRVVMTIAEAFEHLHKLKRPCKILIREEGKYMHVLKRVFDPDHIPETNHDEAPVIEEVIVDDFLEEEEMPF